jgi:hypothetical protein
MKFEQDFIMVLCSIQKTFGEFAEHTWVCVASVIVSTVGVFMIRKACGVSIEVAEPGSPEAKAAVRRFIGQG